MQNIGIFYGSSTGNTELAAKLIQQEFGADNAQIFEVSTAKVADIEQFSILIFGSSTWGVGDVQDDFETFLPTLSSANLDGKKAAIFGLGDQDNFAGSFVDAIGEIYEILQNKGCHVIGKIPTDGYGYEASQAEVDGQFVGLPLDEDNQSDLTPQRIKKWTIQLKDQLA